MLECLCRPRFFAGQVLTADDLNRLEHYIIGKNRLHNRQLHGWGVVNGLEVTCDACGKGVVVGCGYALSPCGDDIVVCEPVAVDVCALIKACKQAERPCEPPRPPTTAGCNGESEWVLAIRYIESPAKGIKPMMPSTTGGCGCGTSACKCGGSAVAKSGCGCGGSTAGRCNCTNGTSKPKPRTAPVQCEPTVICEGYAFDVYKKPPDPPRQDPVRGTQLNPDSELYKRFACCIELLLTQVPPMPGQPTLANIQANLSVWQQWTCTFKDYLQEYLSTKPGYNCELLGRVNLIICPPMNTPNLATVLFQTIQLLWFAWLDAVLACYCSALLPPCPEPYPHGCVPLATIRVSSNPCRVISICNWTIHRKFATTFPALQYWLSILPFGVELRRMLDRLCCMQITVPPPTDIPGTTVPGTPGTNVPGVPAGNNIGGAAATPNDAASERAFKRLNPVAENRERLQAATQILNAAIARGTAPLDPQKFLESAFLADKDKGEGHISAAELDNLPQFFALNQVLRPILLGLMPAQMQSPLGSMGIRFEGMAERGEEPNIDTLRTQIDELRADVERQAEEIKRLKRPRKGKG
jgi:hypothetical protein